MSDIPIDDLTPPAPPPTPPCPICGGATVLTQAHKAVAKVTDVFRCTRCNTEYPVTRKEQS